VRAPQFTGGGVVHGPTPRDYSQRTPKKMKAAALRGALSDRARGGRVHVVSGLVGGDTPSTKAARQALEAVVGAESRGVLVVVGRDDSVNLLSLRNLPQVHLIAPDQLNTYDVLVNDDVVFTSESLEAFLAGPVALGGCLGRSSLLFAPCGSCFPLGCPAKMHGLTRLIGHLHKAAVVGTCRYMP